MTGGADHLISEAETVEMMRATEEALMGLVAEICAKTGFSPMSAMALVTQTQITVLKRFGGPEARAYCIALTKGVFSETEHERRKCNERIGPIQSRMMDHFQRFMADTGRAQ